MRKSMSISAILLETLLLQVFNKELKDERRNYVKGKKIVQRNSKDCNILLPLFG